MMIDAILGAEQCCSDINAKSGDALDRMLAIKAVERWIFSYFKDSLTGQPE